MGVKMSPITVVLVAVAGSLATLAAVESLRHSRSSSPLAAGARPEPRPPSSTGEIEAPHAIAAAISGPTNDLVRLAELESRISALESESISRRTSLVPNGRAGANAKAQPEAKNLRGLVLEYIAEERESRRNAEARKDEQDRLTEMDFSSRYQANALAREHNLVGWQETKLVELFLEIEARRRELEREVNLQTDDPELFEARWVEFDNWADRRYREELGPELVIQLFGEE